MQNCKPAATKISNGFDSHHRDKCIDTMIVPNETWRCIMNFRILAASTLALAALTSAAISETRNGNWDKCPGGFDPATSICLSRDRYDGAFPKESMKSGDSPSISVPLSEQGGEIQ
jgi:hypothetical protein